jgi:hypothetical protein
LKDCDVRAGQSAAISFSGVVVVGGEKSDLTSLRAEALPQVTYSYHMNEGTFVGRDPRELIDEAIAWWNQQVIRIETS